MRVTKVYDKSVRVDGGGLWNLRRVSVCPRGVACGGGIRSEGGVRGGSSCEEVDGYTLGPEIEKSKCAANGKPDAESNLVNGTNDECRDSSDGNTSTGAVINLNSGIVTNCNADIVTRRKKDCVIREQVYGQPRKSQRSKKMPAYLSEYKVS